MREVDRQSALVLASASPRRLEILRSIGIDALVEPVEIDESPRAGESAADYVVRLAREKVLAWQRRRGPDESAPPALAADTTVALNGRLFGKPRDRADGIAMLLALGGQIHSVYSGVAVLQGGSLRSAVSCTRVTLREVSNAEAAAYWASGEPVDKAGGYAIQGRGGVFVRRIEGSYSGVVGLPVYETAELLAATGLLFLPAVNDLDDRNA